MSDKMISTNPKDFPIFGNLTNDELDCGVINLIYPIEYFSNSELGIDWKDIKYNKTYISEIVDLVQRRRVYFHVYHDIEMGELNEACLICFWILKLCPFYDIKNPNNNVNLKFAISLLTRSVSYTAIKKGRTPNLTVTVINHFIHAFTYRDLSKEAIMALAESLIG